MTQTKEDEVKVGGGQGRVPPVRIRQRAYELWERNHCPPGLEMRFWLLAERQLRDETPASVGGKGA